VLLAGKEMIISRIIGGLGNQMFQYAAGRALALRNGVQLKLDLSAYAKSGRDLNERVFGLDAFRINAGEASEHERFGFRSRGSTRAFRMLQRAFPSAFSKIYAAESGSRFHKNFFRYPASTYLDGYWQNERYFLEYESTLRAEFRLKTEPPHDVYPVPAEGTVAVSVHVRRGDYVSNKEAHGLHFVCDKRYYSDAISEVTARAGHAHLFVFSDDEAWCRNYLDTQGNPVTYMRDSGDPARDMWLMSRCSHHVIANSSFSWWGAWLNGRPGKIVIAPQYWFRNVKSTDVGIACKEWTLIHNQGTDND
jgi:hypothetical protein